MWCHIETIKNNFLKLSHNLFFILILKYFNEDIFLKLKSAVKLTKKCFFQKHPYVTLSATVCMTGQEYDGRSWFCIIFGVFKGFWNGKLNSKSKLTFSLYEYYCVHIMLHVIVSLYWQNEGKIVIESATVSYLRWLVWEVSCRSKKVIKEMCEKSTWRKKLAFLLFQLILHIFRSR